MAQEDKTEKLIREVKTLELVTLLLSLFVVALYILLWPLTRDALILLLVVVCLCAGCVQLARMTKRASLQT